MSYSIKPLLPDHHFCNTTFLFGTLFGSTRVLEPEYQWRIGPSNSLRPKPGIGKIQNWHFGNPIEAEAEPQPAGSGVCGTQTVQRTFQDN